MGLCLKTFALAIFCVLSRTRHLCCCRKLIRFREIMKVSPLRINSHHASNNHGLLSSSCFMLVKRVAQIMSVLYRKKKTVAFKNIENLSLMLIVKPPPPAFYY